MTSVTSRVMCPSVRTQSLLPFDGGTFPCLKRRKTQSRIGNGCRSRSLDPRYVTSHMRPRFESPPPLAPRHGHKQTEGHSRMDHMTAPSPGLHHSRASSIDAVEHGSSSSLLYHMCHLGIPSSSTAPFHDCCHRRSFAALLRFHSASAPTTLAPAPIHAVCPCQHIFGLDYGARVGTLEASPFQCIHTVYIIPLYRETRAFKASRPLYYNIYLHLVSMPCTPKWGIHNNICTQRK